jgi:hypothetical protein
MQGCTGGVNRFPPDDQGQMCARKKHWGPFGLQTGRIIRMKKAAHEMSLSRVGAVPLLVSFSRPMVQ